MNKLLVLLCTLLVANLSFSVVTDGTFDRSFAVNGGLVIPDLGTSSLCYSVAITADDSILTAGSANVGGTLYQAITKIAADGTPDTSFGTNGAVVNLAVQVSANPPAGFGPELVLYPDERILVGQTNTANDIVITRYLSNGAVDTTFGSGDGSVVISIGTDQFGGLALQDDEKIVIVGTDTVPGDGFIIRLNSNGSLDTDFGTNGIVTNALPALNRVFMTSVQIDAHGRFVIGGYENNGGVIRPFIARFTTAGDLDTTFGASLGYTIVSGGNRFIRQTTIQNDGSFLQVGVDASVNRGLLIKYTKDGLLDASFGQAGITLFSVTGATLPGFSDLVIQSDGKCVVSGNCTISGVLNFLLARFNTDGSLDRSFGQSGSVITTPLPDGGLLESLAIDSNNNIISVGYTYAAPGQTIPNTTVVRAVVDSLRSSQLAHALWDRYYNQNNH